MLLRSTAHLLVVVMLLASGRLLACGWECKDQLAAAAAAAEASCHEDSAPDRAGLPTVASAKVGEPSHACLPEIAESHGTAAKMVAAQTMTAAPLVTVFITADRPFDSAVRLRSARPRFDSPPTPAPSVLRI